MRSAFVLGLFSALFLLTLATSSASAEAMQAKNTPNNTEVQQTLDALGTPTFEAYFPTSTSFFDMDNTCPTGIPLGYGTVTPGLMWEAQCGNCAAQVTLSATPAPTLTITPGGPTLTPAPTATTTPDPLWELHFESSVGSAYSAGSAPFVMSVNPEVAGRIVGVVVLYFSQPSAQQVRTMHAAPSTYSPFNLGHHSMAGQVVAIWTPAVLFTPLNGAQIKDAFAVSHGWLDWMGPGSSGSLTEFDVDEQTAGVIRAQINQLGPGNQSTFQPYGYVYFGDPIEQATPTPVQSGYCGSVQGTQLDGIGVELPQVGIGDASCSGLPQFVIPMGWVEDIPVVDWQFEDVNFPGLQICFRPLVISNFNLFGVSINVELALLVLAGAMMLRWVLRS